MNDVIFADKYSVFEKAETQKFNKCLKVLVPVQNGNGGSIAYGNGKDEHYDYTSGDYVIIPPYSYYKFLKVDGEDRVVCIEQPLVPSTLLVSVAASKSQGMQFAIQEAAIYLSDNQSGAVLSALGQLIVGYVTENYSVGLHPVVISLKADMEKNFTDSSYSAETAIRKLPLNYDYVRKLFKRQTGATPHEYLNGIRMDRARAYILNGISNSYSNFTVSQISEACGFAEPLYFSRAFKKHFGVSPLQYAKDNADKQE